MFLQLLIFSFSHRLQLAFFLAFLALQLPGLLKLTCPHDQLAQERQRPDSAVGPLAGPGLLLPHLPRHPHRGQQGGDRLGGVHQPQLHPNSLYSLSHWLLRRLFYHSGALISDFGKFQEKQLPIFRSHRSWATCTRRSLPQHLQYLGCSFRFYSFYIFSIRLMQSLFAAIAFFYSPYLRWR